jgi:hypothetical protein
MVGTNPALGAERIEALRRTVILLTLPQLRVTVVERISAVEAMV